MKLLIINGSPKKTTSNTTYFMDIFVKGFLEEKGNECLIKYVGSASESQIHIIKNEIKLYDNILFVFPVFYHSIPGNMQKFMENLDIYSKDKKVSFFIQQTYINSERSLILIEQLKSFSRHINTDYNGTFFKGLGPSVGMLKKGNKFFLKRMIFKCIEMIDNDLGKHLNYKKISKNFLEMGIYYGTHGVFEKRLIEEYMSPKRMSKKSFLIFKLMVENMFFKKILKKYGTYHKRYDMPHYKE